MSDFDVTMAAIAKAATEKGDEFRVKVARKRQDFDPAPQVIAIFDHATQAQIADADLWLPLLAGGGAFSLAVSHQKAIGLSLGKALTFKVDGDAQSAINREAIGADGWRGPLELVGPVESVKSDVKSEPRDSDAQSRRTQSALAFEAERIKSESRGEARADAVRAVALLTEAERQTQRVNEERAALERQKLELERQKFMLVQQPVQQGPGIADMLKTFMEIQAKSEEARREDQRRADEARREDQRRADERAERLAKEAEERNEKFMLLLNKPDPIREALISRALTPPPVVNQNEQLIEFAKASTAAMNGMMGSAMQMMQTKMELQKLEQPQEDDQGPIYKLAGRVLDIFEPQSKRAGNENEGDDSSEGEVVDGEVTGASSAQHPLDALDAGIYEMLPAFKLMPSFLEALGTTEFKELWNRHSGNVEALVTDRYGRWVMDDFKTRESYLKRELPKLFKAAVGLGIFGESSGKSDKTGEKSSDKPNGKAKKKKEPVEAVPEVEASATETVDSTPATTA